MCLDVQFKGVTHFTLFFFRAAENEGSLLLPLDGIFSKAWYAKFKNIPRKITFLTKGKSNRLCENLKTYLKKKLCYFYRIFMSTKLYWYCYLKI